MHISNQGCILHIILQLAVYSTFQHEYLSMQIFMNLCHIQQPHMIPLYRCRTLFYQFSTEYKLLQPTHGPTDVCIVNSGKQLGSPSQRHSHLTSLSLPVTLLTISSWPLTKEASNINKIQRENICKKSVNGTSNQKTH